MSQIADWGIVGDIRHILLSIFSSVKIYATIHGFLHDLLSSAIYKNTLAVFAV